MAQTNLMSLAHRPAAPGQRVIIDVTGNTVTQQLHDALAKAQTKAIACSYPIPPSSGGTPVDFTKVNVSFTSGSNQTTTIGHTTGSSACDKGGWYYDVDPAHGTPTKIIACPSTCSSFQGERNGQRADRPRLPDDQRDLTLARSSADQRLEASSLQPCAPA